MQEISILPRQSKRNDIMQNDSLRMDSVIKPPMLSRLGSEWKRQSQAEDNQKQSKMSLEYSQSHHKQPDSDLVKVLMLKVESLQHQLESLSSKHEQMVARLLLQVKYKTQMNQQLRKQNQVILQQMEEMNKDVGRMREIVANQLQTHSKSSKKLQTYDEYAIIRHQRKILRPGTRSKSRSISRTELSKSKINHNSDLEKFYKSKTPGASRHEELKQNYYNTPEPSSNHRSSRSLRRSKRLSGQLIHSNRSPPKIKQEHKIKRVM